MLFPTYQHEINVECAREGNILVNSQSLTDFMNANRYFFLNCVLQIGNLIKNIDLKAKQTREIRNMFHF